jgi:uncharacterized membrane protein
MVEPSSIRALLPRLVRRPPADLTAAFVATVLVNGTAFVPVVRGTALRVPIGLAFVLFVPGYVVVAALFPERGRSDERALPGTERSRSWWGRIDGVDRIALSVALSVTIVPAVGYATSIALQEYRLEPALVAVSIVTVITTAIAARRRSAVPSDERFQVPYRDWLVTVRTTILEPDTRREAVLNVALIGSVLLAVGSVGYAAAVLPQDKEFSAIYVLSEGEEETDPVALELVPGESQEIVVGVENEEERTVEYTVVVVEQMLNSSGDVTEQRELDRFEAQVDHGKTWRRAHDLEPTASGEDVRIGWLLYVDDEPDNPSTTDADYHVYLTTGEPDDGGDADQGAESVVA